MTITSRELSSTPYKPVASGRITTSTKHKPSIFNRLIAAAIWFCGVVTTYAFVDALIGADLTVQVKAPIAIALQIAFTAAARPAFKREINLVAIVAIIVDTAINLGGLYPLATKLGNTPTAIAIVAAASIKPGVAPKAAFVLAALFGFLLIAAPLDLWER